MSDTMWQAWTNQINKVHDRVALGLFIIIMTVLVFVGIGSLFALAVWAAHWGQ